MSATNRTILQLLALLLVSAWMSLVQAESIRYEFGESSRSVMRVGPNQTLDQLVEQLYPTNEALWPQLKQEIKKRNPHAFNRYTGGLVVGEKLQLVTIRKIREGTQRTLETTGSVMAIQGNAVATDKYGKTRRLALNDVIYEGDRLETDYAATLSVKMVDDAEMHIKPNSALRVSEYVQKGGFETGSRSVLDLIRGGLRKISGAIGANPINVYRLRTGVMTIGVRGTDYVVMLCSDKSCEQSSGRNDRGAQLHLAVLDGIITLQDEGGQQGEMISGQYAVAMPDKVIMMNEDEIPSPGFMNENEKAYFNRLEHDDSGSSLWPWLLGGALLGL